MTEFRKYIYDSDKNIADQIVWNEDTQFTQWNYYAFEVDESLQERNESLESFIIWAEKNNINWAYASELAKEDLQLLLVDKIGEALTYRVIEATHPVTRIAIYGWLHPIGQ